MWCIWRQSSWVFVAVTFSSHHYDFDELSVGKHILFFLSSVCLHTVWWGGWRRYAYIQFDEEDDDDMPTYSLMRRMTTISTFAITSHKGKCSSTTRLIKYCDKRLFKIWENVEISFLLICLFHESRRNFTIYGCSSIFPYYNLEKPN